MKNGLSFFRRTNSAGCWNLASFHNPHSLTWSWILSFDLPRTDEGRWLYFSKYRANTGLQWSLQVARMCLRWHRQRPMFYRDLYYRLRDEHDFRPRAAMPRPPLRSPFKPMVIEGDQSLH